MNSMNGCFGQNEPQTSTPLKLVQHYLSSTGNRYDMQTSHDDESNLNGKNTRFLGTRAVSILTKWFNDNRDYPYPNDLITEKLARDANISAKQVKKWFANKRVRSQSCFKPIHRTRKRSSTDQTTSSPTWTNQPDGTNNDCSVEQERSQSNLMNLFPPSQYFANMSNDFVSRSLLNSMPTPPVNASRFFSNQSLVPPHTQTNISFLKSLAVSFYTQQQQMALLNSLLSHQNKSCSSSNYSQSTNETGTETSNSQNNEDDLSISIENLSSAGQQHNQDHQMPNAQNETASSNLSSIDNNNSSTNISPTISSSSPASTSTSSSKSVTDPSISTTPRLPPSLADTKKTAKLDKKINFAVISTLID